MFAKDSRKLFCLLAGLLGLVLVGFGVFLLSIFFFDFITIGTIVSGILLLVSCCITKCHKVPCIVCLILTIITLFLILSGVFSVFIGALITGSILIGLGVLAALLTAICLIFQFCGVAILKCGPSPC